MNDQLLIPKMGLRFSLSGSLFEIVFFKNGIVRYSTVAGGKIYQISNEIFCEKIKLGEIEVTTDLDGVLLSKKTSNRIMLKQNYIKSVLNMVESLYSEKKIQIAIQKISKQINDPFPPHPRTVMRWTKQYLENGNDIFALNRFHTGNKFLRFPPELESLITRGIEEEYLGYKEHRTADDVIKNIKAKMLEQNINILHCPSLRTIQRKIKQLDPYIVMRAKKGSRIANSVFKAAGIKKSSPFLMACVEIDTHNLDIFVIESESKQVLGRPFLSCAIDIHTRCIIGLYISMLPVNASSTLGVLKDMLNRPHNGFPGGIPSLIIPDNGVEFKNSAFSHVCNELGITIQPAQNRTPNDKPHIERFFGTLTKGLIQKIRGTTFSNPRERGDYNSQKTAGVTLDNLRSYIHEWIEEIYHKSIHSELGRAPIAAWNDSIKISPPALLSSFQINVITRKALKKRINHGQVRFDYLTYKSHALATLQAQGISDVIVLVDESDLDHVYIQDPFDTSNYIQADSTTPTYTKNLTFYEHELILQERKKLSNIDREKLGIHTIDYARWKLYERIQSDSKLKDKKSKQLKIKMPQRYKDLICEQLIFMDDKTDSSLKNASYKSLPKDVDVTETEPNIEINVDKLSEFTTMEFKR